MSPVRVGLALCGENWKTAGAEKVAGAWLRRVKGYLVFRGPLVQEPEDAQYAITILTKLKNNVEQQLRVDNLVLICLPR